MKCGCKIEYMRDRTEEKTIRGQYIEYCPMHKVAPEMLDFIKTLTPKKRGNGLYDVITREAKELIKKAKP